MRKVIYLLILSAVVVLSGSCKKHEVYFDHPFIYITNSSGGSTSTVDAQAIRTDDYMVYISTKTINRPIKVEYEIITGDGVTEGVDFQVVSGTQSPLEFPTNLFDMAIRIHWLRNTVNDSKDNTVTIKLVANSENFTMGFPGPDQNNISHIITKENRD